jgi:hypothetical protein
MKQKTRRVILGVQSLYYLFTGLWPLFHIAGFMEVTGYKTDLWLVKTVGVLIVCAAAAFIVELFYRENSRAVVCLSISSAAGLMGIDLYYSLSGVISNVYLIDAMIQLLTIGAWIPVLIRSGK